MIDDSQAKLAEVIAQSALTIASIFFAALTVLVGAIVSLPAESGRRPLRTGVVLAASFTGLSLALTVVAFVTIRFRGSDAYALMILLTVATMLGMAAVAAVMTIYAFRRR